jgi:phage recombination protein Bet
MSTAVIQMRPQSLSTLEFTDEQKQMIRDSYAMGASDQEFAMLLEIARVRRLNPLLRQIHFVRRWNPDLNRYVWAPQVSIDGMRAIAQRTGLYDGQDETECIYKTGTDGNERLICCKTRVYRKDWQRAAVGVAHWREYVQTTKDGSVTRFWREKPHVMLAKCSEAIALRKAFPEDLSGIYADAEMGAESAELMPEPTSPPRELRIAHAPSPVAESNRLSPGDALAQRLRQRKSGSEATGDDEREPTMEEMAAAFAD